MIAAPSANASPLAHRDFRVLCLSTGFSGMVFRGQLVVLGWLILDRSDSAFMVGLGIGVMMAPNALFGLLGGAIADRFDRRQLMRLVSLATSLFSLLLGCVVLAGGGLWLLLLVTFLSGSFNSVQQASRASYAYDVVGAGRVVSAMSLMTLTRLVGGIVGSLGVGEIISRWGAGEAYIATACAGLVSWFIILFARTRGEAAPHERQPLLANLREYAGEIRSNRTLATLILLTASVEILGFSHLSALPVLVRDELGRGGSALGLMSAVSSAGGIAGILLFSSRGDGTRKGVSFVAVLCLFGLALVFLGLSKTLMVALLAMTLVASLAALSDVLSQSLVQVSVPNEMRGRAMGSWSLAIGMAPLGHLEIGALMSLLGVTLALMTNGIALLLLALVVALRVPRLRTL